MRRARWLALGLAVLGLLLMLVQSRRPVAQATDALTLLTPGFGGSSDAPAGLTLALPGVASDVPQIPDVGYLTRHYRDLRTLTLRGDGLRETDLQRLPKTVRINFSPPTPMTGLRRVSWPDVVQVGSSLVVEGKVALPDGAAWKVELRNPAGTVTSTTLRGKEEQFFRLSDSPPAVGRFVYQLIVRDEGGQKVAGGDFGLEVRPARKLSVLLLEDAPRFETRALKSWLAGQGFAVAVRSRLGKVVFRKEELNGALLPDGVLREEALRAFDLALIDGATLRNLSPEENTALERAVRADGPGLLVLAAAGLPRMEEQKALLPFAWAAAGKELQEKRIIWPDLNAPLEGAVEIFPVELTVGASDRALLLDPEGRPLAVARRAGEGMVALSSVTETQRWLLQGQTGNFGAYWSHLLGEVVSAPRAGSAWNRAESGPILPDQPLEWQLRTDEKSPAASWRDARGNIYPLALKQELFDARTWTATCWPRTSGWHTVRLAGGAEASFWVAPPEQWREEEAARRREETSQWANARGAAASEESASATVGVLGALLFFGGAGSLWVVERGKR